MSADSINKVEEAVAWIRSRGPVEPVVGVVLGSGLGPLVAVLDADFECSTAEIPHWPKSTVQGHAGRLRYGRMGGVPIVMLEGRVHGYEGYGLDEVVFPVRILARLGIRSLILTNSAGGVNRSFQPGDLMLIEDHLNLIGGSPLRGPNIESWGPRFPDMSSVYDIGLRECALDFANLREVELRRGVYAAMAGPQYETPAEVRMLERLGADAVGMSTVPEAIAARHMGVLVLGFSVISNLAAGISPTPLCHEEVVECGRRVGAMFSDYLAGLLPRVAQQGGTRP